MRDPYEVLGVERTATADDIKRAFRRLAHQVHPDKNPGDAASEERFKEATWAYELLSDPVLRRQHDRSAGGGFGANAGSTSPETQSAEFNELFGDLFGKRRGHAVRRHGKDRFLELELDLRTAIHGGERTLDIERTSRCGGCRGTGAKPGSAPQLCHACGGSGTIHVQHGTQELNKRCTYCKGRGRLIQSPCQQCGGNGSLTRPAVLKVTIPPGTEDGTVLRYTGEGAPGEGGPPGDLRLTLKVKKHPIFERQGPDLSCTVPITFADAALGGEVEVPTLDGRVRMKLPAGTQTGRVFRLRGKGPPLPDGQGRGDQHVTVVVETPQALGARERALVEELRGLATSSTYPQHDEFWRKHKEGA